MKSFYNYVVNNFYDEDSIEGDFAFDMERDKELTKEMKENDELLFTYMNKRLHDEDVKKVYKKLKKRYLGG